MYWIDGDVTTGDNSLGYIYDIVSESNPKFHLAQSEADILGFINSVYAEYIARKKMPNRSNIFVVLSNLQWIDIVNKMLKHENIEEEMILGTEAAASTEETAPFDFGLSSDSSDSYGTGDKLIKLINDGASSGIFFIVSSNECASVKESMYYGENVMSKFPMRIVFSLNDNDADYLINNVSLTSLRDNIVYFTDGVKNTFQYKPFRIPSVSEKELIEKMLPSE
jgi:hypothetical protein